MATTVSAVIVTLGEPQRRSRLLSVIEKALAQDGGVQEVLLVWQGEEDQDFFVGLPSGTRVIVETIAGVSRARNIGAQEASSDWLWFLDDDTEPVLNSALAKSLDVALRAQLDFVLANIRSSGSVQAAVPISKDVEISRRTLRGNFWEAGLLILRSRFLAVRYDETIGIGCLHGSSEGFDLGARLLNHGAQGRRLASYVLDHPELSMSARSDIERTFFYSMGNGVVLIKNRFFGLYIFEHARAAKTLFWGLVTGRRAIIRWAVVRALCLVLGPLVPRRPPRIVPPRGTTNIL